MVLKISQNFYNKRDQTKPEPLHLLVAEQMGDLIKDGETVKYAILCKKNEIILWVCSARSFSPGEITIFQSLNFPESCAHRFIAAAPGNPEQYCQLSYFLLSLDQREPLDQRQQQQQYCHLSYFIVCSVLIVLSTYSIKKCRRQ